MTETEIPAERMPVWVACQEDNDQLGTRFGGLGYRENGKWLPLCTSTDESVAPLDVDYWCELEKAPPLRVLADGALIHEVEQSRETLVDFRGVLYDDGQSEETFASDSFRYRFAGFGMGVEAMLQGMQSLMQETPVPDPDRTKELRKRFGIDT